MDVDGWITIGTKIDNSQLEKELRNYERELKRFDKDTEKLLKQKAKIEVDLSQFELAKEAIQYDTDQELKLAQTTEQVNYVLKEEEDQLKIINAGLEITQEELDTINSKIKNNTDSQELVKQKIEEINVKLKQSENYDNIKKSIDGVGTSVEKVIKKVTRWGLAIFGVRSAYFFVRQAMSTLTQYNDQLATDINYIKFAIASTLEPVIVRIVELVYKLLGIVGTLIKRLTGYNIFKNSGVDKFQKGIKDSAKSAKELKNQLAGFDEMNVLQDTSETGTSSDTGGVAPSIDLSKIKNQKVPEWMETLVKIGKWIIDNWETVVGMLLLTKLFIDVITGNWIGAVIDIIGFIILGASQIGKAFKTLGEEIGKVWSDFVEWFSKKINGLVDNFNKFREKVVNVWKDIRDKIKNIITDIQTWLTNKFGAIGTAIGNIIGTKFKNVINAILRETEKFLNSPIRAINGLIGIINKVSPKKIDKLQTFSFPRLAKGGIINMPSRGVPVGGAIAGERGMEGVIPLTDSQQMSLLGEAIGKYITINAQMNNYMDGRLISRQMEKIQSQRDFVMNGR